MDELKLYTLKELEGILGVSYRTLLKYVRDGKLKAVKIGKKWRVTADNLKKFLNGDSNDEKSIVSENTDQRRV